MITASLYDSEISRSLKHDRQNRGRKNERPRADTREMLTGAGRPSKGIAIEFGCGTDFFSQERIDAFAPAPFGPVGGIYVGQGLGATDCFTHLQLGPNLSMVNARQARGPIANPCTSLLGLLRSVHVARRFNRTVQAKCANSKRADRASTLLTLGAPLFAASKSLERVVAGLARNERLRHQRDLRDDQMFLSYLRTSAQSRP